MIEYFPKQIHDHSERFTELDPPVQLGWSTIEAARRRQYVDRQRRISRKPHQR
jgi:hypothetical protein